MQPDKKETYPAKKPEDTQFENQEEFDIRSPEEKATSLEDDKVKTSTGEADESIRKEDIASS